MGTSDVKVMSLRRDGQCDCGAAVLKGTRAGWDRIRRVVICEVCLAAGDGSSVDIGVPGASLQREYERRMATREARITERFPRVGRILLKVFEPAQSTRAFVVGAEGEREVAARLARELDDEVLFLHNRRRGTGGEGGDIDMIAIAPSGVWIIDPKKYAGRKVRRDRQTEAFVVDGRRRSHLSESMRRQIEVVSAAMASAPVSDVAVHPAYCFLGADLPWGRLVVDGVPALSLRGITRQLRQRGPLDAEQRGALHRYLHQRFPSA